MKISEKLRQKVRKRAGFACEFCGVRETDVGGELTIDHYRPKTKGGTDEPANLIYCCLRCNIYKHDYWPAQADQLPLWNPRKASRDHHFLLLDDGKLYPLTPVGSLTILRLRLNRPPLIAYRLKKMQEREKLHLLTRYNELLNLIESLQMQLAQLIEEQGALLKEQQRILRLLLRKKR